MKNTLKKIFKVLKKIVKIISISLISIIVVIIILDLSVSLYKYTHKEAEFIDKYYGLAIEYNNNIYVERDFDYIEYDIDASCLNNSTRQYVEYSSSKFWQYYAALRFYTYFNDTNQSVIFLEDNSALGPMGNGSGLLFKENFEFPTVKNTKVKSVVLDNSDNEISIEDDETVQKIIDNIENPNNMVAILVDYMPENSIRGVFLVYDGVPIRQKIGTCINKGEGITFEKYIPIKQ